MSNVLPTILNDPLTGEMVIYAPQRAHRSNAFASDLCTMPMDEFCPFCPGMEHETPPEISRWPADASQPWQVRVIPNRFPIVSSEANASGHHEIIIESAQHEDTWLSMSRDSLALVLQMIERRLKHYQTMEKVQYIQVFKNVGSRAGASLAHPHLQLLALPFRPPIVEKEMALARASLDSLNTYYLHQLVEEMPKELLLVESNDFLAYCPLVSRMPYQIRVISRSGMEYNSISEMMHRELAAILQGCLKKLEKTVGAVAHNILWKLPPQNTLHYPWYIDIVPRLTTIAGLELSTGVYVNPIPPDMAAQRLRGAS